MPLPRRSFRTSMLIEKKSAEQREEWTEHRMFVDDCSLTQLTVELTAQTPYPDSEGRISVSFPIVTMCSSARHTLDLQFFCIVSMLIKRVEMPHRGKTVECNSSSVVCNSAENRSPLLCHPGILQKSCFGNPNCRQLQLHTYLPPTTKFIITLMH